MPQFNYQTTKLPNYQIESVREFVRRAALFALFALGLYGALYVWSERLVYRYAHRNRFYQVKTASSSTYDYVILGASHAAVLDLGGMNRRLEEMTGSRILNLSIVGAGVSVNRLLLEYFLAAHQTAAIVYLVDSFAFYSRQWNEERLNDSRLFLRAPFDAALVKLLLNNSKTRARALDYIVGFSKINNGNRFVPDVADEEARFDREYRPVQQIDEQRIEYLYLEPLSRGNADVERYLSEFEDLVRYAASRNVRVLVVKSPLPEKFYRMIPNEQQFDAALGRRLARQRVEFHDWSLVGNETGLFFDSDHLNRAGVENFFERFLSGIMRPAAPRR